MALRQERRQIVTRQVVPQLIIANTILQQTASELAQEIDNELQENPALELVERPRPCNGDCLDPATCPWCSQIRPEGPAGPASDQSPAPSAPLSAFNDEPSDDFMGGLEAELTLQEHLCALLHAQLPREDHFIADYLVHCLDDNGWLSATPEEIAAELDVDTATVLRILTVLQSLDPPGVGARDLQECLLIQLRSLAEEGKGNPLAEQVVQHCFVDLVNKRYGRIARALHISLQRARDTVDFIREQLNPYPASQFRPPWDYNGLGQRAPVRPDLLITRTEFGYDIAIAGADPKSLSISPAYLAEYNRIKNGDTHLPPEQRQHVIEYVERAHRLIANILQRNRTLERITRLLVEWQQGYLETGSRAFLRPVTRTLVAEALGIHESTVSRATAGKFVRLPNMEVVPFSIFFNSSLCVKKAIEEIIEAEDPLKPFTDQEISEMLRERGFAVSRRTVVKYRHAIRLLSSKDRRNR
ncbi:MAG: RNA polymerase factor sigma-54 [Chthonomonadales bacterium]